MKLYMVLRNGGPLCWQDAEHTAPMVFESEDLAEIELVKEEAEGSFVAAIESGVIVERLRAGDFREVFYVTPDDGAGLVAIEEFDHAFNPTPERVEEIVRKEKEAIVRRMMMELVAKGEAEWDLDTDTYSTIPSEEREGK